MKATRIFASLILVAATAGAAQAQFVRCSWNTCDPQVVNQNFAGPAVYRLILSAVGADAPNVGSETRVLVYPAVPDAWRFDDGGCQTASQISFTSNAFSKTCVSMRGTNPLPITFYGYDPVSTNAEIVMFNAYDTFDPAPEIRYTLWNIGFDHSFSVAGPTNPGVDCGGAEAGLALQVTRGILARADGQNDVMSTGPGDSNPCVWNMGPVATEKSTMGRLKAQYR